MVSLTAILQVIFGINSGFVFSNTFSEVFNSKITGILHLIKTKLDEMQAKLNATEGFVISELDNRTTDGGKQEFQVMQDTIRAIDFKRESIHVQVESRIENIVTSNAFSYSCFYAAITSLGYLIIGCLFNEPLNQRLMLGVTNYTLVSCSLVLCFYLVSLIWKNLKNWINGYLFVLISIIIGIYYGYTKESLILSFFPEENKLFCFNCFILLAVSFHFIAETSISFFRSFAAFLKVSVSFFNLNREFNKFEDESEIVRRVVINMEQKENNEGESSNTGTDT